MCADVAIHDKGDGNPHAHIMLTTRGFNPDGSWSKKEKSVYKLDASGNKIGESRVGFFGQMKHYDETGHKTGETVRGFLGELNHYDETGKKTGHSTPGLFGKWNDYDD